MIRIFKEIKNRIKGGIEFLKAKNDRKRSEEKLAEQLAERIGPRVEMGTLNFNIHRARILEMVQKNDSEGVKNFIAKQRKKYLGQSTPRKIFR